MNMESGQGDKEEKPKEEVIVEGTVVYPKRWNANNSSPWRRTPAVTDADSDKESKKVADSLRHLNRTYPGVYVGEHSPESQRLVDRQTFAVLATRALAALSVEEQRDAKKYNIGLESSVDADGRMLVRIAQWKNGWTSTGKVFGAYQHDDGMIADLIRDEIRSLRTRPHF